MRGVDVNAVIRKLGDILSFGDRRHRHGQFVPFIFETLIVSEFNFGAGFILFLQNACRDNRRSGESHGVLFFAGLFVDDFNFETVRREIKTVGDGQVKRASRNLQTSFLPFDGLNFFADNIFNISFGNFLDTFGRVFRRKKILGIKINRAEFGFEFVRIFLKESVGVLNAVAEKSSENFKAFVF